MATTTGGTTYVTSTDLVANYPTASLALANRVDVVASGSMSKKTASYTVTVADILAGTTIAMNSASATVITLPSASLVNGMMLNVFSVNTGAVTFTGGTVTGAVNSISAQYTGVSLTYDSAAAVWWCLPFGGSVGAANFTNTATGTYSGYKYVTFTGNGSLIIDKAGLVDILVIAGGGAGGVNNTYASGLYGGGGGAGGYSYLTSVYLSAATHTVTVGAGGAFGVANSGGSSSTIGSIYNAIGGGSGGIQDGFGNMGGSGGGGGSGNSPKNGAASMLPSVQGFAGGNAVVVTKYTSGGGGGSSAAGANGGGASGVGGAGGAGTSNSITGSAVTRAGGGGGYGETTGGAAGSGGGGAGGGGASGTAGTVNTGGGGGNGANGGSGVVIVRVAV
jgi:hypothetical protein